MNAKGTNTSPSVGGIVRGLARQLLVYTIVGGLATMIDWGSFWCLNTLLHIDYHLAVVASFVLGAVANFFFNKNLTFRHVSTRINSQVPLYVLVVAASLSLSLIFMHVQVQWLHVPSMVARVLTTGVMLVVNFLLQKLIVFERSLRFLKS